MREVVTEKDSTPPLPGLGLCECKPEDALGVGECCPLCIQAKTGTFVAVERFEGYRWKYRREYRFTVIERPSASYTPGEYAKAVQEVTEMMTGEKVSVTEIMTGEKVWDTQ